jgi:hypothetical protein
MEGFYEMLAVTSFRDSPISVSLARFEEHDNPLIGCSLGFEVLNGFTEEEIMGYNCRFLNAGCHVKAEQRHGLRIAVRTGRPFIGRVQNRRKNGERFEALLHLGHIRISDSTYILGIQHTQTGSRVPSSDLCKEKFQQIVNAMFDTIAAAEVALESPSIPYIPQLSTDSAPPRKQSTESATTPVAIETAKYSYKNTFLSVCDWRDDSIADAPLLRPSVSESNLASFLMASSREEQREDNEDQPSARLGSPNGNVKQRQTIGYPSTPDSSDQEQRQDSPTASFLQMMERSPSHWPARDTGYESPTGQSQLEKTPTRISTASVGSVGHPGNCTPCAFHCYSLCGCKKGSDCEYCHMDHPKKTQRCRKQKGKASKGRLHEPDSPVWSKTTNASSKDSEASNNRRRR